MADIQVRQAGLDDTQAISNLFRSRIHVWQRLDERGRVEDVAYGALTIYERWLHGGAWMSVETAAIHLNQLLSGAGQALVAEGDGQVLAYAEGYEGAEPMPFGAHLHLAHLLVDTEHGTEGLDAALAEALIQRAKLLKCQYVTVSRMTDAIETQVFDQQYKLKGLAKLRRFTMSAKTGQIFYQATEHLNADSGQISGWYMPVGRLTSARQQWETLWSRTFETLPGNRRQKTHRMRFTAAGQEAFVCCKQQMYDPRSADVYCWSPKPLTSQLLSGIRDWAHREGYRTLVLAVTEDTVKTLGAEAEADGYTQDVCAVAAS
jgi:GNAT superfamily N-acetyltransferase